MSEWFVLDIPDSYIDTDSYIGVQLIEKQGKLDFESLKYMSETVEGSFTFSLLNTNNNLYLVKGNNPLYLLHFKDLGIYIYTSTENIMKAALGRLGLHKFASKKIDVIEGDILCINKNGELTRSTFEPKHYRSKYARWYDFNDSPFYTAQEEILLAYCGCYGVDSQDVELLFEYGYTCDEVEEMLMDTDLLNEALRDVKFMCGESLYESCYEGAF